MMSRLVSVLALLLLVLAGCSDLSRDPVSPERAPLPDRASAALASDGSIDLSGVLEFAELPSLTSQRHAEKYIRAAEGGFVELHGFRVDIPAGALPADTLVTIDLPADELLGKHLLAEFGPHGVQFSQPVTIRFPLTGVLVPSSTGIEVARWENGAWTSLGGTVSADGDYLFGTTPHFSTYSGHVMAGG